MSDVTANESVHRGIRVIRNAFTTLAGFALDERDPADGLRRVCALCGASAWAGRHCLTCHTDAHPSCFGCGACLPQRVRSGRRYCSTTCRVRVHNYYRHTGDGQARLVREAAQRAQFWAAFAGAWPASPEQRQTRRSPVRESWQTRRYHPGFARRVTCSHRCDLTLSCIAGRRSGTRLRASPSTAVCVASESTPAAVTPSTAQMPVARRRTGHGVRSRPRHDARPRRPGAAPPTWPSSPMQPKHQRRTTS